MECFVAGETQMTSLMDAALLEEPPQGESVARKPRESNPTQPNPSLCALAIDPSL